MKMCNNQWLKLSYLSFLCFSLLTYSLTSATDRITGNSSLSGDLTISSPGEVFELGFFNPLETNSSSNTYYIGIWYKQISVKTIVWVANRENPISDHHSTELKIQNGNLVLTNTSSNSPIWSTNLPNSTSNSLEAVLLDSGNLVLRDGPENVIWQSFDHPADTWLPGGKIVFNKRTNRSTLLTCWKNTVDPTPGLFSLQLDPNNQQYLIMWNQTEQYWTSGSWDPNQQIFSLVPEMRLNFNYDFAYIDNENESYFTYSVRNPSLLSRFVMDVSGQIRQLTWFENTQQWNLFWAQPRQQCQVHAYCGAFGTCTDQNSSVCSCLNGFEPNSQSDWGLRDYSGGCTRRNPLQQCGNGGYSSTEERESDRFWVYSNMGLPQNPQSVMAASLDECEMSCLNNCSCTAYSYDSSNGCSLWFGQLMNLQHLSEGDASGNTLYIRLSASEFPSNSNTKLVIGIVLGSVGGILVLLTMIITIFYWKRNKRLTKGIEGSLIAFSYRELQTATKNFSEKVGGGGFGSVFKGKLPDLSLIAVKKLESFSQGEKQFRAEVNTIGAVQHVNLVRLRGFCSQGAHKLLVYDYMPNGSLDSHLFINKTNLKLLNWKSRYQIAQGTARGLAYLHEKCRDCIVHCDIKPENILIDSDFCPKIADFGLAKLIGRDFSRVITTMRGTRGYLAPEWLSGGAITPKADVFSYGMMLFELISGRRNTEQSADHGQLQFFFPAWAASKLADGEEEIMSILDPRLEGDADVEQVMRLCKLACWCVQDNEDCRPSMGQVVQILEGVLDVNMPPMPRSLLLFANDHEHVVFFTEESSSSIQSSESISRNSSSSSSTSSLG